MHAPTKPRLSAPRILTARVRVFFSRVDIIVVRHVDHAVGESDACIRLLLRRTVKLEVRRKVRFGRRAGDPPGPLTPAGLCALRV